MLELVDEGLEALLRAEVPLSSTDIDVSFAPPDREWSGRLVRPTVNLFLHELRRSAGRAQSGLRTIQRNGETVRQPAFPMVELRYVVSAWASDHGDERGLLSGLMRALLATSTLPHTYLSESVRHLDPPTLLIARVGEDHLDVFKALDGKIKPGINLVVTTAFDTEVTYPAGPPVTSIDVGLGRVARETEEWHRRVAGEIVRANPSGTIDIDVEAVGAIVRSPADASRVNEAGRFLLRAKTGDEITIETSPPLVTTVPERGGVRFER